MSLQEQPLSTSPSISQQNDESDVQFNEGLKDYIVSIVEECFKKLMKTHLPNVLSSSSNVTQPRDDNQQSTPRHKLKPHKRLQVWKTYMGNCMEASCVCCKTRPINVFDFHCGHVIARANGGTLELSNLRPICSICNQSMNIMDMREFAKEEYNIDLM
jgi:hypothetical protein